MTLIISRVYTYDSDVSAYITAVEAADGQPLEAAVCKAINAFVVGCKNDGTWNAIKASCILAGARTLSGALVPLTGTAPAKNGTEGGWNYNRKTGLQGNGTDNYLNSNRNNNADPQNNRHFGLFVSTADSLSGARQYIGTQDLAGGSVLGRSSATGNLYAALSNESDLAFNGRGSHVGFIGVRRNLGSSITLRSSSTETTNTIASQSTRNESVWVFARPSSTNFTNARLAFYSIGESLDLARLDSRVTSLINAFAAAIP